MRSGLTVLLLLGACDAYDTGTTVPTSDDESAFLERCEREMLERYENAAAWAPAECSATWSRIAAAAWIVAALESVVPRQRGASASLSEIKAGLSDIEWSGEDSAMLAIGGFGDVTVALQGTPDAVSAIGFGWQEVAERPPYAVIQALRLASVRVDTLGCPEFAGASQGEERVMRVEFPRRAPIALTVYERPAPTAIEWSVLAVDADLSGTIPTAAALRSGDYPGGGGRAWTTEPLGWSTECADLY